MTAAPVRRAPKRAAQRPPDSRDRRRSCVALNNANKTGGTFERAQRGKKQAKHYRRVNKNHEIEGRTYFPSALIFMTKPRQKSREAVNNIYKPPRFCWFYSAKRHSDDITAA
jgi:hypothetical protein